MLCHVSNVAEVPLCRTALFGLHNGRSLRHDHAANRVHGLSWESIPGRYYPKDGSSPPQTLEPFLLA